MATVTHHAASTSEPGAIELIEATGDGLAAGGLVLMSFLGAIPGLLPVAVLTIAAGAILLIPMLVIGLLVGVVWAIAVLIARLARRLAAVLAPSDRREHVAASEPAPLRTGVAAHRPRPTAL